MMTAEEVRKRIEELSEPSYQQFSARLIPNVNAERIHGVRLPHLRKLAKEIAKGDWRAYLEEKSEVEKTFEETMLRGLVIGYAKMEWKERHRWICDFLPQIDNWSVCDSFCSTLKPAKHEKEKMWTFVKQCMQSDQVYTVRFGVVMGLDHFGEESYLWEAFRYFDEITLEDYYVKMAVAWAVSVYYVQHPELTMQYLIKNKLDDFTYNKALQKITESLRVGKEEKEKIRSMKRK